MSGQIGSLGDVIFTVSSKLIRTIDDLTRSSAPRWTNHDVHLQKPKSQFIGPGLDTISFTIRFDARLGVEPRKEADRLINLAQKGKPVAFAIGGKKLGTYLWKLMNVEQGYTRVDNRGNVLVMDVTISLEEYAK